jgi:hypothetical protein
MHRRRQHKVPKVPRRDGLTLLLDQAAMQLVAHGMVRLGDHAEGFRQALGVES